MSEQIDEISLKILKILQQRARIPNVDVARQVGLAPSAVLERIRKLESQGFIDGYEVRLNPEQFSRSLIAFITAHTRKLTDVRSAGKQLAAISGIQEVHYITGEDAFLLKIRVADNRALDSFIQEEIASIKAVKSIRTAVVLSTYKETAKIPIPDVS
ncbi:MAG: Lrp/AsnC family transcriptional regulator [Acidobacteriota bacterium]|jgi:Lrp/AsnC family leucine-responsive transcriptional regulator